MRETRLERAFPSKTMPENKGSWGEWDPRRRFSMQQTFQSIAAPPKVSCYWNKSPGSGMLGQMCWDKCAATLSPQSSTRTQKEPAVQGRMDECAGTNVQGRMCWDECAATRGRRPTWAIKSEKCPGGVSPGKRSWYRWPGTNVLPQLSREEWARKIVLAKVS